jgi:hypothetical protein
MSQPLSRPFSTGEFPELEVLRALIQRAGDALRHDIVGEVTLRDARFPLYCLELGSTAPEVPAIGFFGGIHGVERIGTQVLLAFLHTLIERLHWDQSLNHLLQNLRLVFMPLINPGGMLARTRCNPAGVDLMRNAPLDSSEAVPFLLGGQRYSPVLPWYRGRAGAPMQSEAQALCAVVEQRLLSHRFSMALDCHSGFGSKDRIWFPYAHSRQPIDCLPEIYALRSLFRSTHPYHSIYTIEPQAHQYTTHGDLWDYLYQHSRVQQPQSLFMPLTLEMGSWLWVKKSPAQIFSLLGMFNPVAPHRHQRILRTHLTFFDFLLRATLSHPQWLPSPQLRPSLHEAAIAYWYHAQSPNPGAMR